MQSLPIDIVVFGEAMAMFMADDYLPLEEVEHYTRALAGAEVNVATGLARLGFRVGWISRLGRDPLGRFILNAVGKSGIDTTQVLFDDRHPTGFQLKSRVKAGDPEVVYFRRGSAASFMAPSPEDDAYISSARHLHVTGIPPALSASCREYSFHAVEVARKAGLSISFDPNLRPSLWKTREEMVAVLNELACKCDWVLVGLSEGKILTGYDSPAEMAEFYLKGGASLVAVKTGPLGASLFSEKEKYDMAAFPVQVVDTVGAGDGFAVGIISGMLEKLSLTESLERGNAIGALAVMSPGDQDGLPDQASLASFLQTQKHKNLIDNFEQEHYV